MNNTFLEINLKNLKENILNLKQLLKPETKFLAVVKSNAYGHGLIECAKTSVEAGADFLGVINIKEAMTIRKIGMTTSILILRPIDLEETQVAAENNISIPVFDLDYAKAMSSKKHPKPLKVHLKIETGLNRLGLLKDDAKKAYDILKKNNQIIIEGIYSHLAAVEEEKLDFTAKQIDNFNEVVSDFKKDNIDFELKHIAASAAGMLLPESHLDMVRFGISIYGLWPSREVQETFIPKNADEFLKPVMAYKTEIIQIKEVKSGENIGYGRTYEAKSDMTIAIIPVGYYEGLDRRLSNKGEVLISGKRCNIVGRVCMNMAIVDISKAEAKVGDEVVIIGKQGKDQITADEVAKKCDTINYEIVSRIPSEIYRKYK